MAIWFYRGLRKGIVTTRYPKALEPWTRDLPSAPAFHGRGLTTMLADRLVQACPAHALKREGRELAVDLGRCTGCGHCIQVGDGIVRPSGESLLATKDRSALIKRVPIRDDEEGAR
jgi:dissimilatory sulfite reductase (desulfoviridin) alpha/beta subunit